MVRGMREVNGRCDMGYTDMQDDFLQEIWGYLPSLPVFQDIIVQFKDPHDILAEGWIDGPLSFRVMYLPETQQVTGYYWQNGINIQWLATILRVHVSDIPMRGVALTE